MDDVLKKVRVRFSYMGEENKDDQYNTKGRIPVQKTVSFKGDRKRNGRWFQRQFSRQLSDASHISDGDFETAIAAAAAAYAIAYMEQEGSPDQKDPTKGMGRLPTKTESKMGDTGDKPTNASSATSKPTDISISKLSRQLSGNEAKGNEKSTGESSMRKSATFDQRMLETSIDNADGQKTGNARGERSTRKSASFDQRMPGTSINNADGQKTGNASGEKAMRKSKSLDQLMLEDPMTKKQMLEKAPISDGKMPEKATGTIPSVKKTPTFSDKYLNDTESNRFDDTPYTRVEQSEVLRYPRTVAPRKEETKADVWEKEHTAKIRKWYEKVNQKILQWENEKKMKAKRRLERRERELEERRARYLQEYRNEVSRIDKVASGARAMSEERKRNKELKMKAKAKAKQLKSTGKVPGTCLCFQIQSSAK